MSEPEDFLARWSRRKREAAPASPDSEAPEAAASAAEPSVDLAALPPIESITAATDIRPYLAPGVPAELTRAALRRAWVADPAIRDFVGIAENQWDFNDPQGVPGFGPLDEDVARLVARMLGDDGAGERRPAPAAENPGGTALADAAASRLDADATAGHVAAVAADRAAPEGLRPDMSSGETAVAPRHDPELQPASHAPTRRGHGGALPK